MSLSCLEPASQKVLSLLDRDIHQQESHCILQLSVERRCVFWSVVPLEYSHAHHVGWLAVVPVSDEFLVAEV